MATGTKETSDLGLAAFLVAKGFKLVSLPQHGSARKLVFVFDQSEEIEKATLHYFNRQGEIDGLTYNETLRNLKSLL